MNLKTLLAAAIAAAFATSLAQAADDKAATGTSASSESAGAKKMFDALDKNKDGYLSHEEVKGTPHDKDFSTLDKNNDGKLSREEHAAAPEHAGDKASTGATTAPASPASGGASSDTPKKY